MLPVIGFKLESLTLASVKNDDKKEGEVPWGIQNNNPLDIQVTEDKKEGLSLNIETNNNPVDIKTSEEKTGL